MRRHKWYSPEEIPDKKLYPTEAINSVQEKLNLSRNNIKTKLFIDAIIYERPIIQMSHVLGSFKTASIFLEMPELLSDRIFTISTTHKSFSAYRGFLLNKKYETKKKELSRLGVSYNKNEHMELELFTDLKEISPSQRMEHAGTVLNLVRDKSAELVYFDPTKSVPLFKEILLNSNAIVNRSVRTRRETYALDSLTRIIEKGSYFEPFWTQYMIKKMVDISNLEEKTLKSCEELVETSYFLTGGAILGASIGIDTRFYPAIFRRCEKTIDKDYLREKVLRRILDFYGIDPNAISSLSADSLKTIRKDPITRRLRNKIETTLKKSGFFAEDAILKELCETIDTESRIEKASQYLTRCTMYALDLAPAFLPGVTIAGDLLLELISRKQPTIPMTLFCTKLLPKEIAKSRLKNFL